MNIISSILWNEWFWLPINVSWADFKKYPHLNLPVYWHCLLPIPIAVCLFLLRLAFERFIATPIAKLYKLKETSPKRPKHNDVLECAFKENKSIPKNQRLKNLSKQTDFEYRQIEVWWKRRKLSCNLSVMQKFCETSWRFFFYFTAFWYGIFVLWDKPYFTETKYCWINHPFQNVDNYIWWYYQIEMGFYWSLIMSVSMDVKRKDFIEMLCHHVATIFLMSFSFVVNFLRIGSLVVVVHDAVDWWLEMAKMFKYLNYPKTTDAIFICFTIVWAVTRLYIFPFYILYSAIFESYEISGGYFPSHSFFNFLLVVLQILHIYWFFLICKMIYKYIINGTVEKDERSESEIESSEEDLDTPNNNKHSLKSE